MKKAGWAVRWGLLALLLLALGAACSQDEGSDGGAQDNPTQGEDAGDLGGDLGEDGGDEGGVDADAPDGVEDVLEDVSEPDKGAWELDYGAAFPADRVQTVKLVFRAEDWEEMQQDLAELMGGLGPGGGLCEGLEEGDACELDFGGGPVEAECQKLGPGLVECFPVDECAELELGEACEANFGFGPMGGQCQEVAPGVALCLPQDPCSELALGDECSFDGGAGVVLGTCQEQGPGGPLGCQPSEPCEGGEVGEECVVESFDGPIPGTCQEVVEGVLGCFPPDACDGKVEGDECSFEGFDGELQGRCQAQGERVVCLPQSIPQLAVCAEKQDGEECTLGEGVGRCEGYEGRRVCVVDGFDEADLSGVPLEAAAQFWPREPSYFPCTVELGEHRWTWVGVRYKGNNSLASAGASPKKPLRMDFDQFEDEHPETEDQRFFGFKQLSWTNNVTDPSFLRQRVAAEIFRRAGVPTTQAAFYEVRLDPGTGQEQRLGLYTATELPRAPFLEANFADADGHLYKPDGRGAHFASYHPESYHPKHDEDATDFGDIEAFVEALHGDQSDRALWRARLEERFDMEGFLRFLAVNQVMTNWDTYGALAHNFYLYAPASDGRLRFIPWDFDLALGGEETDLSLAHFDGQWPLLQAIARDPVYFARYAALVREVVEGPFAQEEVEGLIRAQAALVRPYALAEGKTEAELDEAVGQLLEIVATRHEKARAFLAEWEAP